MKDLSLNYSLTLQPSPKIKLDLGGQTKLTFPWLVTAAILLGIYLAWKSKPVNQEQDWTL